MSTYTKNGFQGMNISRKLGLSIYFLSLFASGLFAQENGIGLKLVDIPAGSFYMGSPEDENYRTNGETLHKVNISKSFKMGAYEVTQGQWKAVMDYDMKELLDRRTKEAEASKKERQAERSLSTEEKKKLVDARKAPDGHRVGKKIKLSAEQKEESNITRNEVKSLKEKHKAEVKAGTHLSYGANFPVGFVSWTEAVEFCQKLTEREHAAGLLDKAWSYRLPTEAEWEYACRAGTSTAVFTGAQPQYHDRNSVQEFKKVAWVNTNSGDRKHEVGQLKPNAWGLYDIYGNVTEWCLDIYAAYSDKEVTDPLVLEGPGMMRTSRGLNAHCTLNGVRSATRKTGGPKMPFYALFGFRVVCAEIDSATSSVPANHTNL